jgi:AraC-like DNA-binding protein|nr:AraC family transcriptional regulator [Acinetobacter tandoii]
MKYASKFMLQPSWKLFLIDLGVQPEDVLRLASLPRDAFNRKKFHVTATQYFDFWNAIETVSGVENLPLKIGQMITVELFDPAIFACICSPNLTVALQRLSHFKRLIGPIALHPKVDENVLSLDIEFYEVDTEIPKSLILTELIFFTQLARICTRAQIIPKAIYLPELPNDIEKYQEFFGVTPQKSKGISIQFSKTDGERTFLTSNSTMWSFFEPNLKQSLAELDHSVATKEKVKAILLESLPAGLGNIDEVAKRLALSKRTLQRLLEDENTNFKTILDDTRKALAEYYLKQSSISTSEISFLLGFQEVNSFSRAFKHWTGATPNTYRHQYS